MLPKFREIDSIPDPEQRALALTMFRSIIAIEDESYGERVHVVKSCGEAGCSICDETTDEYLERHGWAS